MNKTTKILYEALKRIGSGTLDVFPPLGAAPRNALIDIEQRIDQKPTERTINNYKVIRGVEAVIETVETVAKIKVV